VWEGYAVSELSWGRRYVMVRPDHFRVDYTINPYMDLADQPDPRRAMAQWVDLVSTIERLGGHVEVVPQRPDAPDMVYAMNLGLGVVRPAGTGLATGHVVLSHMRYAERRMETQSAGAWFERSGRSTSYVGRDGVGAHLEAGDVFAWGDGLVAGFGPRTEELALKHLATDLGVRVRGVRITHPSMYHLDLAFCPLDERHALVAPGAFDSPSAAALLDLVPEPLVLTDEEALTTFCANSIVVGRTVVMPAGAPVRVVEQLRDWDFDVVEVDVSEFHKGGGSVRCLSNPVDVTLGRDVPMVAGGEVVVPPLD
jgi:N-dimethylarginine dimethylaminohydrolase